MKQYKNETIVQIKSSNSGFNVSWVCSENCSRVSLLNSNRNLLENVCTGFRFMSHCLHSSIFRTISGVSGRNTPEVSTTC